RQRLDTLVVKDPPVTLPKEAPRKGVHWVRPELVAEVEFAGWTADRILRHASFQGLREDKSPREVVYDPQNVPAADAVAAPARDGSVQFEGVRLTHPGRVLYPEDGLAKLDLARYYKAV